MASATYAQSRAKPVLISVRGVMALKLERGKVESENLACKAWLVLYVTDGILYHRSHFSGILYCLFFFFLPLYHCYTGFIGIPSPGFRLSQTSVHHWPLLIGSSFCVCSLSLTVSTEQNTGVGFLTGSDSERGFMCGWTPGKKTHCQCTLVRCQALPGHGNFPLKAATCQEEKTHWTREEVANGISLCWKLTWQT